MLNLNFLKIFILSIVILSATFIYLHIPAKTCQLFSIQAQSFVSGRLDIPQNLDAVYINGKYYWPQGPFPSLILIPFQLIFSPNFNQIIMQPFLVIILAILLYRLARLKKFLPKSALLLTYVFLFGSQIIGIITEPCYSFFAHVITLVLLTAILLEFESNKRPVILGLLLSAILSTRPTAGFVFIPIIYHFYKNSGKDRTINIASFMSPIVTTILLLLWFNQIRFQNPLDNGYAINNIGNYLDVLRKEGIFSIGHIPSNFYYYFLISIQPIIARSTNLVFPFFTYNSVGLSLFIVAPFFLYSLKSLSNKNITIKLYWFAILITLLLLLSYYSPGWVQFGPRFLSDIMPILYLLLLNSFNSSKLSTKHQIIILLSSLINIYLLLTGFFLFKK